MSSRRDIERMIGAVLAPEVRSPGTIASASEVVPSRDYLARFPPAMVVAFGRTPAGAVSPIPQLERVRAMCRELGEAEPLVACDLEQGAGLHFAEGTRLPPALALVAAGGESASSFTALEARRFGVRLVLAPVADINTHRDNPIIAVRSFGDEPQSVAERALRFLRGLHDGGVGGCAKHFPGHGDTSQDSHLVLPRVDRSVEQLREVELVPFRALIDAGVETVMVAHLDVPALTREPGLPCTLSKRVVSELLRDELGFHGVIVSDAMNMRALSKFERSYERALNAGIDILLCPHDAAAAADKLLRAVAAGSLDVDRLEQAAMRAHDLRDRMALKMPAAAECARLEASSRKLESVAAHVPELQAWTSRRSQFSDYADRFAQRALRASSALPWPAGSKFSVRDAWPGTETLEVQMCVTALRDPTTADERKVVIPVVCEARALLGKYGPSADELAALERELDTLLAAGKQVVLAWFGSPQTLPERLWNDPRVAIVLAFAPTPPMFGAVERFLRGSSTPPSGSLPAKLG